MFDRNIEECYSRNFILAQEKIAFFFEIFIKLPHFYNFINKNPSLSCIFAPDKLKFFKKKYFLYECSYKNHHIG